MSYDITVSIIIFLFAFGISFLILKLESSPEFTSKKKAENIFLWQFSDKCLQEKYSYKVHKILKDPVERLKAKRRYNFDISYDYKFRKIESGFRNIYEIDIIKIFYMFDKKFGGVFQKIIHPQIFMINGGFNIPIIKGSELLIAIQDYYKIEENIASYLLKTWIDNSLIFGNYKHADNCLEEESTYTIGSKLAGSILSNNSSQDKTEHTFSFGKVFEYSAQNSIMELHNNNITYLQWKMLEAYRFFILNIFSESKFYELEKDKLLLQFSRHSILSEKTVDEYLKFWIDYGLLKKYIYVPKYKGKKAERTTYGISNILKIYRHSINHK